MAAITPATTRAGGAVISVGFGPFAELLPATGKLGAAVKILGTDSDGFNQRYFR